ncbi:MAG: hypothetical protein ACR2QL_04390 [Woeseiaceae bacterium]
MSSPTVDNYGLEISAASDAARDSFLQGMDCALSLDHPGIEQLTRTVECDPEFALAHALLARQLFIHGFAPMAQQHMSLAEQLAHTATRREQSTINVLSATLGFNFDALSLAKAHIETWPQDTIVLTLLLGPFGLLAFSGDRQWRQQNMDLLNLVATAFPEDDWWFTSTVGFMSAETGDLATARSMAETALQLRNTGNCAHTLAHVHFEETAIDEGQEFIRDWCQQYPDSDMRHHMIWHSAMLSLEAGDTDGLLDLYAGELDAAVCDPMPLETLSDNASLLWRCRLRGLSVPADSCEAMYEYSRRHFPAAGFPFADIHCSMMAAILGIGATKDYRAELANVDSNVGEVVDRFTRGFYAFADGAYAEAADLLQQSNDSIFLGGSNPQRRVVEETRQAALQHLSG